MAARLAALLAGMRTGSNHLEASLASLPGVEGLGEVFNPHFIGQHNRFELEGMDLAAREADPLELLRRVAARPGLSVIRLFRDHDPRAVEAVLADAAIPKIVLSRNPVEAYVSLRIAQETGQWKLTNPKMARSARIAFDGAEFDAMTAAETAFRQRINAVLQRTGQAAFWIDYADINDLDVVAGLARFLGLEAGPEATGGKLKRQNPGEVADKVSNPDAMTAHLAGLDPFALPSLPSTEPPGGPAVPGLMAVDGLLCLPVPGGPTEALRDWLAASGEVATGMTQRALRQWLRRNKGYAGFAVLRHPLARAHDVFAARVLRGGGELRRLIVRHYGAPLPENGRPDPDDAAHRAAFEAFLRFAKANLGGQTALPPGAEWGHQLAALQGMAQVIPPLRILREDEAPDALAALAPAAPRFAIPEGAGPSLAAIHDDALEDLALEVWRRDYLTFGFRRWRR